MTEECSFIFNSDDCNSPFSVLVPSNRWVFLYQYGAFILRLLMSAPMPRSTVLVRSRGKTTWASVAGCWAGSPTPEIVAVCSTLHIALLILNVFLWVWTFYLSIFSKFDNHWLMSDLIKCFIIYYIQSFCKKCLYDDKLSPYMSLFILMIFRISIGIDYKSMRLFPFRVWWSMRYS